MHTDDLIANDWDVAGEERFYRSLRRYWHPVLYASELGTGPRQPIPLLTTLEDTETV